MPTLEHDKVIAEYYETIKDKYPNIDFERFRLICRSPFLYIKLCIKSLVMPIIHIKYLGTFKVFPPKLKGALYGLELAYIQGKCDKEYYDKQKEFLVSHLKRLEDEENIIPDKEIELIQE